MSIPYIIKGIKRYNSLQTFQKNYSNINRYNIDKPQNITKNSIYLKNLASSLSNIILSTNNVSKLSLTSSKNTFCALNKINTISLKNNSMRENTKLKNVTNRFNSSLSNSNINNSSEKNITLFKRCDIQDKAMRCFKKPIKLSKYSFQFTDDKKVKINKDIIDNLDKKNNQINYIKINNINKFKSKKVLTNIDKILTRFKITNIISKQLKNHCTSYQNNNKLFNERVQNTLLNDKFIDKEIKRHRHFRFGKNINIITELKNYITNFEDISKDKKRLIEEDLLKSLNEKDIKLILSDISYFKDVNKKIVNKLKNLKSFTLKDIIEQEDAINNENNIENNESQLQKSKEEEEKEKKEKEEENENDNNEEENITDINNNKNLVFSKYEKHINKLINNDLNERLKTMNIKRKKDIIDNNINACELNTRMTIGKQSMEHYGRLEEACFRSFFEEMDQKMKRQYYLENNNKRLCKEDFFQYRRKEKLQKEKETNEIMNNNLNFFKQIYFHK